LNNKQLETVKHDLSMKVTVDIDKSTMSNLCRITGVRTKSAATAMAVKKYVEREMAKEFGRLLREGYFDYAFTNDESEKTQG
jgi:Arc/MetJ family transcription regulator